VPRIKETWARAEAAGINTMITNNESPHVVQAVKEYLCGAGAPACGKLQWITQVAFGENRTMSDAVAQAASIGARAMYAHGGITDEAYVKKDEKLVRDWCACVHAKGLPAGFAGHDPEAHLWVDSLNVADFHVICFFNCGSLHRGKGDKFSLADLAPAAACVRRIRKPCIAYKIMGAGRIDARTAFQYAFESIKPGDVVNVGMHRGDKDNMVEENAALVQEILGRSAG
jgi:hypothetical protein